jgi:uncharacterized protein with GYD domain
VYGGSTVAPARREVLDSPSADASYRWRSFVRLVAGAVAAIRERGGAKRVEAAHVMAACLGGTLESYYFAFGDTDVFAIFDLPDDEAALAGTLAGKRQ